MIRFVDEFRSKGAAAALAQEIKRIMPERHLSFMEICGGHTLTAMKFGLHQLLPRQLALKSGPGCPVCVTAQDYIDTALILSRQPGTIIATFGDMMRVPGSVTSLLKEKASGADIRVCLSPLDAVRIAEENSNKQVVFLGIGFETSAPTVGMAIIEAGERKLKNLTVLCALKTMPQAMRALCASSELVLDGFICPGHVTAVAGTKIYEQVVIEFRLPCVVSGFEPTDILATIVMLLRQIQEGRSAVENQYTRVVHRDGNKSALDVIEQVFTPVNSIWRGLGMIPQSGLAINEHYSRFDASLRFPVELPEPFENPECICGDVMRGVKKPSACSLFGKVCQPDNPIGACMVSAEGACGIHYMYHEK